jgi:hypothetical protein
MFEWSQIMLSNLIYHIQRMVMLSLFIVASKW